MFWLKVRKEYVLENFEDLLSYLRALNIDPNTMADRSDFRSTIKCMEELCCDLGRQIADTPSYTPLPEGIDPVLTGRLMGATLLAQVRCGRDTSAVMTALMNLVPFVTKSSGEVLARLQNVLVLSMAGREVSELKYQWRDLENGVFTLPLFINRISDTTFAEPAEGVGVTGYENKGSLTISPYGDVKFFPGMNLQKIRERATRRQAEVRPTLGVYVSTDVADSPTGFLERYRSYNLLIDSQKNVQPAPRKALKVYDPGSEVKVRVVKIEKGISIDKVIVESVSPDYEKISGLLFVKTFELYRPAAYEIMNSIAEDDVFLATYNLIPNSNKARFDMSRQFERAYRKVASGYAAETVLAVYDHDYPNGYQLITEDGVRVGLEKSKIENLDEDEMDEFYKRLEVGQPVSVTFYDDEPPMNGERFYMYCEPAEDSLPPLSAKVSKSDANSKIVDDCLEEMWAMAGGVGEVTASVDRLLPDSRPVTALARLLWKETMNSNIEPARRLTLLSTVTMLYRLAGNEEDVRAMMLERSYLQRLVAFASNSEVGPLNIPSPDITELPNARRYAAIVNALSEYKSAENVLPSMVVSDNSNIEKTAERVASLVKASNEIVDIVGAVELNNIKRAIVRAVDVEEEYVPILSGRSHYGMENITREFKKSIVFPPVNRRRIATQAADHNYQKWAIFKTVCGFLNSRAGGQLILGVNDGGYAEGVKDDIDELFRQGKLSEPTLDRYRTYIQNLIDYTFADSNSPSVASTDITALNVGYTEEINAEGKQLLHILVKPYPYGIVKFRSDLPRPEDFKESYVRRSGSTMPITSNLVREIMDYKTDEGASANVDVVALRTALADKRVVILKEYASNSGTRDREVEPYRVWPERGLCYGYDREKKKGRVFKVSRCRKVEITDKKWTSYHCPVDIKLDPFGFMVDESKAVEVHLLLSAFAAQLLREENRDAPISENTLDSKDKYPYAMRCKVGALEGVTRFCLGLPGEIKVVEGERLIETIRAKAQVLMEL